MFRAQIIDEENNVICPVFIFFSRVMVIKIQGLFYKISACVRYNKKRARKSNKRVPSRHLPIQS